MSDRVSGAIKCETAKDEKILELRDRVALLQAENTRLHNELAVCAGFISLAKKEIDTKFSTMFEEIMEVLR